MAERKHGMWDTPEHKIWCGMKQRCNNPNSVSYPRYGGRGIKVCKQWDDPESGFQTFLGDLGKRPSEKHSLDRINNDGDYCPGNCRWTDSTTQQFNRATFKNNTSGVKGVQKDGISWRATHGGNLQKRFSTNKYGETGAFFLAALCKKCWEI